MVVKVAGWKQLLRGWPWFQGEGRYPIPAYSEFLPPPRRARKPYGELQTLPFQADDPWGWYITEYEERLELRPGVQEIARQLLGALRHLGAGEPSHGISPAKLNGNLYWPETLAEHAGRLRHEHYVILQSLALAQTQDDKGRVRWTLFGGSEQGPGRAFWRGFYSAPDQELPREQALDFFRQLLHIVYREPLHSLSDLGRSGFRIIPAEPDPDFPHWTEEPLPSWTRPLLWRAKQPLRGIKYVLTFRRFDQLPSAIQDAYLAGELHLLPFPGSLVFWGALPYRRLERDLPTAVQIPLQHMIGRHEGWQRLRVPQTGWLHDERPGDTRAYPPHSPIRNTFTRTHRWEKVLRHEDEVALEGREDRVTHVLFSSLPDDLGLYGKPMARNAQLYTHDFQPLLNGPEATPEELDRALHTVNQGGLFGYRFQYPPMRVGRHEVFWHRPLAAYWAPRMREPVLLPNCPLGYLTAYHADKPDHAQPVELWPRLLQREPHLAALELLDNEEAHYPLQSALNARKVLDSSDLLDGQPLTRALARALLATSKKDTLDTWLEKIAEKMLNPRQGQELVDDLRKAVQPSDGPLPAPLTYDRTGRRSFEVAYWKTIAFLADGKYRTKNNADCVRDTVTQEHLRRHHHRDLETLGDYLLRYYGKAVARAGMARKALVGDLPFTWQTDFNYEWMGGWLRNQRGETNERNLITVIPGRDRSRAVVMADHYDTAYMADRYDPQYGGDGARLAANGADDNHSATAALMLAAPIFLEMSRAGRLGCDVWLIHLTGEEFPADCLGARHLCQSLVEGTLQMRFPSGRRHDLSQTRVQGVYVADMIAHNNDRDRDTFQMSPGIGAASFWLANQAHLATEIWNAGTAEWNRRPSRRHRKRGTRSGDGRTIPEIAKHMWLYGEVRPPYDPRSTLYNTDGQIFSDAGVPVVLLMENYDINRSGYHDTHDTMANIDLDYGAAVAAIFIESVARAATERSPIL